MKKSLRVGLVGAGMISRHHLIAWSRADQAEVVAICDPDKNRSVERAAEFGIPRVFENAAEMLAAEKFDAIDIASPRETHVEMVHLSADRGIPVLCQKPLAPTLKEAERLVVDVSGKIRLMVHENWRFRPQYRKIKSWIDLGRTGPLHSCSLTFRSSGFLPDANGHRVALERQPFMQHEQYLMIREVLIHQIDVVRWLLGPLQLIGARAAKRVPDIKGETCATIFLETADGRPVVVDGDFAAAGYPPRATDRFELSGGEASIRFVGDTLELLGPKPEKQIIDLDAAYQESFDATIAHFVECIISGADFETDGPDNLLTLQLVEEAERSAGLR